jgi:hypothetical protein
MCNEKLHRFAYALLILAMLVITISPVLAADSGNNETNTSCGTADLKGFNNSSFPDNETLQSPECSSPVLGKAQSAAFASSYGSCVGDGRGLMEIHAPAGSMYAARGPWGWFAGTDANGNPNWRPTDANGDVCLVVDVCGSSSGQWEIQVKLPDGTIKSSGIFVFSQQLPPPGSNARCYYLFEVTPEPVANTYSITVVGNPGFPFEDVSVNAESCANEVDQKLGDNGLKWKRIFRNEESGVSNADFGTIGGGLNNAVFHYHAGHGSYELYNPLNWGKTALVLGNGQWLYANDVKEKWGNKNKWIFLHSCDLLNDPSWGDALGTTHGIFGFKTQVKDCHVINQFLNFATDDDMPLYDSFYTATNRAYGSDTTAVIVFQNLNQLYGDHLPGHGTVEPDASSDVKAKLEWKCGRLFG